MEDNASDRIIQQRIRSRIMTAVELLAEGRDGARDLGSAWFNYFFDFMCESESADSVSTLSEPEREQLRPQTHNGSQKMMVAAGATAERKRSPQRV